jgi:hypothetical protein
MTAKFKLTISQISNPANFQVRGTNAPQTRPGRIVQNLKARKGQIGDWANFNSFAQFDNVPLDDIEIRVEKIIFIKTASEI